ncbi:MAG: FAD-dependent monooxygenase [Ferruginibacter sp.]|nr:FAD-dependent monooxygenase [Ferruginibacter sp.]
MEKEITIIGAGLVGSLLSIYLSKRGYKVSIYERRGDMRTNVVSAGRSINLALSDRGIRALEEVGIMDEIRRIAIPMHGREIHNPDGTSAYQPYGKEGQFINSVSRADLNCKLMDLAEQHGVTIFFHQKAEAIDWKQNEIHFVNPENESTLFVKSDVILGSDGSFSAARLTHQLQSDRFQYEQFYIDYGYKELHIPGGASSAFQLKENALHIWPRGQYMMIALPNTDGSFTCTLFFPFEGDPSFESLSDETKLREFFEINFSDAMNRMPTLVDDFFSNPTGSLVTVKCFPWIRENKFALIGDAAHAIVPFFGQGMNCGFEDCAVLNQMLDEYSDDWEKALPAYQELRKPDADAIAELALNNFVEMRDKVADPQFLLQKKIEGYFSSKHPDKWTPAYGMVTFSPEIRYSEALQRGKQQQAIMDEIMQMPSLESAWDSETVEKNMLEKISQQNSHV